MTALDKPGRPRSGDSSHTSSRRRPGSQRVKGAGCPGTRPARRFGAGRRRCSRPVDGLRLWNSRTYRRSSQTKWGPALLPTPTVRGGVPCREAWHPALERVPAEAFRPRSVPFRVPRPAREAPFERSQGCLAKRTSPGPLRVASEASSVGFPGRPFRSELRLPFPSGPLEKQAPPENPTGTIERSELRVPSLSRCARRPKASRSAGPVRKSGVGSGFRPRLALLPVRARPFRLLSASPKVRRIPPLSAAASDPPSRFRRRPLFRRP
jgi:hypothetical protein